MSVGYGWNELFFQSLDDFVVAKEEPPVPQPVVSRTAHRMAIHDPDKKGFAGLLSLRSSRVQVKPPGDGHVL